MSSSDLTNTELLRINSSPLVKAYLSEVDSYPFTVPGGTHTVSIINNSTIELSFTIALKNGQVLSSVVPGSSSYNGKYDAINTIDINGSDFNVELGGV
jgi:hypothetical protein